MYRKDYFLPLFGKTLQVILLNYLPLERVYYFIWATITESSVSSVSKNVLMENRITFLEILLKVTKISLPSHWCHFWLIFKSYHFCGQSLKSYPFGKGMTLHLNNLESSLPKYITCNDWLTVKVNLVWAFKEGSVELMFSEFDPWHDPLQDFVWWKKEWI